IARLGGDGAGPWYRVLAINSPWRASSAEQDFIAILPAILSAAHRDSPFVIGWLSRGGGAPLELITNAGPLAGAFPAGHSVGLLFPSGAPGGAAPDNRLSELDPVVWAPRPRRPGGQQPGSPAGHPVRVNARDPYGQAVRLAGGRRADRAHGPGTGRPAHAAQRAPPPRRRAVSLRRRACPAPPRRAGHVPRGRLVECAGARWGGHGGGAWPAGAGARRLGGPRPPPLPAAEHERSAVPGGCVDGEGRRRAGRRPRAVRGDRGRAGHTRRIAPPRGARAAGARRGVLRCDE